MLSLPVAAWRFQTPPPSPLLLNMSQDVTGSTHGGVYVITLNRPNQGNALRMDMYTQIMQHLATARSDKAIRAVAITGAGRFFSTGADVAEAAQSIMGGDVEELIQRLYTGPVALTQAIIDFPKLVVGLVNGPVVGYPAAQLGIYDLVIVNDRASFQVPFLHLGIVPEACSSVTLPAACGHVTATELLVSGKTLNCDEMLKFGLASQKIAAGDDFVAKALTSLNEQLGKCSGASLLEGKKLLLAPKRSVLTAANKQEADALAERFRSGEPARRFAKVFAGLSAKKSKI